MTAKSFEQQLEQLNTIISKLESNELSLDESLAEYKNGIEIIRNCNLFIKKAEEEVEKLTKELNENE